MDKSDKPADLLAKYQSDQTTMSQSMGMCKGLDHLEESDILTTAEGWRRLKIGCFVSKYEIEKQRLNSGRNSEMVILIIYDVKSDVKYSNFNTKCYK